MKSFVIATLCVLALAGVAICQEPVRVSEVVAKQAAVEKIVPEYPTMAKQMRLGGRVEVEALIDTDGNVEKTQVVSGHALLSSAAVSALKRWKFTPFSADGKAHRAVTTITFDFKL
jgi:protein TonB